MSPRNSYEAGPIGIVVIGPCSGNNNLHNIYTLCVCVRASVRALRLHKTCVGKVSLAATGEAVDHAWVQRFVAAHTRLVELGCRLEASHECGPHECGNMLEYCCFLVCILHSGFVSLAGRLPWLRCRGWDAWREMAQTWKVRCSMHWPQQLSQADLVLLLGWHLLNHCSYIDVVSPSS